MSRFKIIGSILVAFCLFQISCTKKDDPAPVLSKREMLTAKTWVFNSILSRDKEIILNCEKNNEYKFNADGSYSYIDAAPICQGDKESVGKWTLSSDETSFSIVDHSGTETFQLETLTPTSLTLSKAMNGGTYKDVFSYSGK